MLISADTLILIKISLFSEEELLLLRESKESIVSTSAYSLLYSTS